MDLKTGILVMLVGIAILGMMVSSVSALSDSDEDEKLKVCDNSQHWVTSTVACQVDGGWWSKTTSCNGYAILDVGGKTEKKISQNTKLNLNVQDYKLGCSNSRISTGASSTTKYNTNDYVDALIKVSVSGEGSDCCNKAYHEATTCFNDVGDKCIFCLTAKAKLYPKYACA